MAGLRKEVKKRNWTFLIYPESAPEDWERRLSDLHLPIAVSPLHDKDINDDGSQKKPHYHVIVCFPGPTTYSNVNENIVLQFNSQHALPVESMRSMYEYLWHKNEDHREKPLYDNNEVRKIGGFRIDDYAGLTKTEIEALRIDIMDFILVNDILEYSDLLDGLKGAGLMQELQFAATHTILFNTYVTSRRHKRKESGSRPG